MKAPRTNSSSSSSSRSRPGCGSGSTSSGRAAARASERPRASARPAGGERRPGRRTQEERSSETRARVLDATVACLFRRGYAGATTTEIARRAGVSRGAQLHHFPTRAGLVTTAVEHLFERRHAEFRAAMQGLPEGAERAREALRLLWQVFSGPTFFAWLELVVAARTDRELRRAVQATTERFGATVRESFVELFPSWAAHAEVMTGIVFALFEGLALEQIALSDGAERSRRLLHALEGLVGRLELSAAGAPGAPRPFREGARHGIVSSIEH